MRQGPRVVKDFLEVHGGELPVAYDDLPSNKEIRDQIQAMARMHEGPKRLETLRDMRLEALRLMRLLARFRPRLIGSVRTYVHTGAALTVTCALSGVFPAGSLAVKRPFRWLNPAPPPTMNSQASTRDAATMSPR